MVAIVFPRAILTNMAATFLLLALLLTEWTQVSLDVPD